MLGFVPRSACVFSVLITLTFLGGTSAAAAMPQKSDAAGTFTALVDFPSLVTRDVGTSKCEFRVDGALTFDGTLEGVASGTTTALIDAPCPEALSNPPGTFRDVFRFEGTFTGTVDGVPATGELRYAGVTRPGGAIDANIHLRADQAKVELRTVDAQIGVGGSYRGVAVTGA